MLDHYNNTVTKRALSPVVVTDNTVQTTQIIDTKGYGAVIFKIATGTLADTDATFAVDARENTASSTSGATDVPSERLIGTEAGASFQFDDDDEVRKILIIPQKRYVYLTITPTGNTGNAPLAAVADLVDPKYAPVTQPQS